jgi:hypothetical protein
MQCFLMQDWITVRGPATAGTSVTQEETDWLDLTPYQDIVVWLAVSELTQPKAAGTLNFDIQTSPCRDEAYFLSMISASPNNGINLSGAVSPSVTVLLKDNALTPLSRWLRWQVNVGSQTPTQVWDATFRIWIAANFRRGGAAISRSNGLGMGTPPFNAGLGGVPMRMGTSKGTSILGLPK